METPDRPVQRAKNEDSSADEQGRGMPNVTVMDRAAALDRVGGDAVLLAEIAKLFLEEYPTQLAAIRAAVAAGNAPELERAAHSLKGSVANFAAPAVVETARMLEQIAREARLESAGELAAVLEQQLEHLRVHVLCASDQEDPLAADYVPARAGGYRVAQSQSGTGRVRIDRDLVSCVPVRSEQIPPDGERVERRRRLRSDGHFNAAFCTGRPQGQENRDSGHDDDRLPGAASV